MRYLPVLMDLSGPRPVHPTMVDPTSDLVDDETPPDCETCGEPATGPQRLVLTRVEDGLVRYRHFCSAVCAPDDN